MHDFGEASNLDVIEHVFTIENIGSQPLCIARVSTDCGCTTAALPTNAIPAGASAPLRATLTLWGRLGPQTKSLRVESDDPQNPVLTLRMQGAVRVDLTVEPTSVFFREFPRHASVTQEVRLVASDDAIRITRVTLDSTNFAAQVWSGPTNAGRGFAVWSLPPFSPGLHKAAAHVETTHPQHKSFLIPVIGMVRLPVVAVPGEVHVSRSGPADAVRRLTVQPGASGSYRILGVDLPSRDAHADINEYGPGRYRIDIHGLAPDPALDGAPVIIRLDHPELPEIRVPVRLVP